MRGLALLWLFGTVASLMIVPVRVPTAQIETVTVREALAVEDGDVTLPTVAGGLTRTLLTARDTAVGLVFAARMQPTADQAQVDTPEMQKFRSSLSATAQTPVGRSVVSYSVFLCQRIGILTAAFLAWLPVLLALTADGFVTRRIRMAHMTAPNPSLWSGCLTAATVLLLSVSVAALWPAVPVLWLQAWPLLLCPLVRTGAGTWHRFL